MNGISFDQWKKHTKIEQICEKTSAVILKNAQIQTLLVSALSIFYRQDIVFPASGLFKKEKKELL